MSLVREADVCRAALSGVRWVGVGSSRAFDPRAAAAAATAAAVGGRRVGLLLVGCSAAYDPEGVAAGVGEAADRTAMIGGSTAGEICGSESTSRGLVVVALGGPGFRVATSAAQIDSLGPRAAGEQAAGCIAAVADSSAQVLLMLSDGTAGDQQEVLRGAYRTAGAGVPLVGGACGTVPGGGAAWQLHDGQVLNGAVVVAALGSQGRFGVGVGHGWQPFGVPLLVTASSGNVVLELDDEPALGVYLSRLPPSAGLVVPTGPGTEWSETEFAKAAMTHPLGLRRRSGPLIRSVIGAQPAAGALVCAAEVPQGALVWLMSGDACSALDGVDQACAQALAGLGGMPPAGLVSFDCVARQRLLGGAGVVEEARRLAAQAAGVPVAGMYTFGEIARTQGLSGFHNKTVAVLAVS